jgi:hypothetical protein
MAMIVTAFDQILAELNRVDALVCCTNADLLGDIAFVALEEPAYVLALVEEVLQSKDMHLYRHTGHCTQWIFPRVLPW